MKIIDIEKIKKSLVKWVIGILAIAFILKENLPEYYILSENSYSTFSESTGNLNGYSIVYRLIINHSQVFYLAVVVGFGLFLVLHNKYFLHNFHQRLILYSVFLFLLIGISLGYLNSKPQEEYSSLSWAINNRDSIFNFNYLKYSLLSGAGIAALILVYKEQIDKSSTVAKYLNN